MAVHIKALRHTLVVDHVCSTTNLGFQPDLPPTSYQLISLHCWNILGMGLDWDIIHGTLDSGCLTPLLPSCCLAVAFLLLFWHFWPPVAPLLLACCFPVALLLLHCCSPVASLSLSCHRAISILPLPVASFRFLSLCYFLPGAFLSLSCRSSRSVS